MNTNSETLWKIDFVLKIRKKQTKKIKCPEIVHDTFLRTVQLISKFDLYFNHLAC